MQTDSLKCAMRNLGWLEHCAARVGSDLEAFSHNPTDDSIATLAAQLIAFTMYQLSIQAASFWALSSLCTRSQVAACCLQLEKAKEAPDSQCLCAMVSLVELFGRQDQPSVMDCRANQVALVCVALKPFFGPCIAEL